MDSPNSYLLNYFPAVQGRSHLVAPKKKKKLIKKKIFIYKIDLQKLIFSSKIFYSPVPPPQLCYNSRADRGRDQVPFQVISNGQFFYQHLFIDLLPSECFNWTARPQNKPNFLVGSLYAMTADRILQMDLTIYLRIGNDMYNIVLMGGSSSRVLIMMHYK
jgi:hypothetical protein